MTIDKFENIFNKKTMNPKKALKGRQYSKWRNMVLTYPNTFSKHMTSTKITVINYLSWTLAHILFKMQQLALRDIVLPYAKHQSKTQLFVFVFWLSSFVRSLLSFWLKIDESLKIKIKCSQELSTSYCCPTQGHFKTCFRIFITLAFVDL